MPDVGTHAEYSQALADMDAERKVASEARVGVITQGAYKNFDTDAKMPGTSEVTSGVRQKLLV